MEGCELLSASKGGRDRKNLHLRITEHKSVPVSVHRISLTEIKANGGRDCSVKERNVLKRKFHITIIKLNSC